MSDVVEWSYDPTASRTHRLVLYGLLGLLGGFALHVLVTIIAIAGARALDGDYSLVLLVGLLGLVGGPFSLLYLWPMLTDPDQRPPFFGFEWRPDTTRVLLACLIGTALLAGSVRFVPGPPTSAVLLAFLVFPVLSQYTLDARIDPSADTLRLYRRTVPLSGLDSVRRVDAGPTTIFVVRYTTGARAGPRVFTAPRSLAEDVEAALRRGVDADPGIETTVDPLGRTPYLVAAGCCLLTGIGFWVVGGRYAGSPAALAPGVALFAILGLLFGWLAWDR